MLAIVFAFQQKLILPTFCVALAIGIAGYFMVWSTPLVQGTGFGYILAGPLTHYFIYELRNQNEEEPNRRDVRMVKRMRFTKASVHEGGYA